VLYVWERVKYIASAPKLTYTCSLPSSLFAQRLFPEDVMKNFLGLLSLAALLQAPFFIPARASAQEAEKVSVQIKAILLDRDLNQKPVGKSKFTIISFGGQSPATTDVTTRFDGVAEVSLSPGKYHVISVQPLDFQSKRYSWNVELNVAAPATILELSNDNATISESPTIAAVEDLVSVYKKYRNSVVTVLAEYGPSKGTGFIIDRSGLVLTNEHVVKRSGFVAVQLDETHRFRATVLAADSEKDVAVLWVNFEKAPEILVAPLLQKGDEPAIEGEKVFTIGSPLSQTKVMTTGIVSKVEKRVIISDININHGNSGGPLFNSRGLVIGITTFGEPSSVGPGISGIVRIEEAQSVIADAKANQASATKPSADLLPNEPTDTYPLEAIKESASQEKFKMDPYIFGVGDYDVAVITPILRYRGLSGEVRAAKEKEKRNRKSASAVQGTFEPLDDLKGWAEYIGQYSPVLLIQASPKLKETFWSGFGRAMAAQHGMVPGPARLHFKTDFYKMKLLCGSEEIQPLMPGKAERVLDVNNTAVRVTDATFDGLYIYPFDAIHPECGTVTLQLFSEKEPNSPKVKQFEAKTITAVFNDFAPYRKQRARVENADSSH
jgi:S1-C subfamily serine protease